MHKPYLCQKAFNCGLSGGFNPSIDELIRGMPHLLCAEMLHASARLDPAMVPLNEWNARVCGLSGRMRHFSEGK